MNLKAHFLIHDGIIN